MYVHILAIIKTPHIKPSSPLVVIKYAYRHPLSHLLSFMAALFMKNIASEPVGHSHISTARCFVETAHLGQLSPGCGSSPCL